MDLIRQRLRTQRLTGAPFATPVEAVRFFGAVQAQDYYGALWAIGQRTKGATEQLVERAVTERVIVRSWPLRGTLHFVAAEDLRWMVSVLAPRTLASTARRFDAVGLDPATRKRARHVVEKALAREGPLTRQVLYQHLEAARISTAAMRGMHIVWGLAHEGVICCGARQGTQHTFALFDEWLPPTATRDRESALAELARRYFVSHGPAKLDDFRWWSGLDAAAARSALELAHPFLQRRMVDDEIYWFGASRAGSASAAAIRSPHATLLPPYDEYLVAYRDRSAALDPAHAEAVRNGIFGPTVLLNGKVAGTWARIEKRHSVAVATRLLIRRTASGSHAIAAAIERYLSFKRPASAAPSRGSQSTR